MTRATLEKIIASGVMLMFYAAAIGSVVAFFWLIRTSGEIVEVSSSAEETVFQTRILDGFAVLVWLILLAISLCLVWAAWAVLRDGMRRRSRLRWRLFWVVSLSASFAGIVIFGSWLSGQGTLTLRTHITIYEHDRIEVTSIFVLWSTTETMAISDVTEVTYDWADHPEQPPMDSVTIVSRSGAELRIEGGLAPSTWLVGRRLADAAGIRLRCLLNWSSKPDETVWNCTY